MIRVSRTELVYRHELHRTATQNDLDRNAGGLQFKELLIRHRWISRDSKALRGFTLYPPEKGPDYIEWKAYVTQ